MVAACPIRSIIERPGRPTVMIMVGFTRPLWADAARSIAWPLHHSVGASAPHSWEVARPPRTRSAHIAPSSRGDANTIWWSHLAALPTGRPRWEERSGR